MPKDNEVDEKVIVANPESAAVEAVAWQLIGEDGEPAFVPYTRHEDALAMVAFYQDDKWLQPRDQEVFTIRELYPQSALDALRGEVERLRADATRYRWLKANCVREWKSDMPHDKGAPSLDIDFEADGHDLDAAIDTALTKESP